MKFGFTSGKQHTGADVFVLIWQAVSLLPLPYLLVLSGYNGLMTKRSVLAFVFDCGLAALPRLLTTGLSYLYWLTGHELIVYFPLPVLALIFGLAMKRLLRGERKTAVAVRVVLCAAVGVDLLLRLFVPLFRTLFGWPFAIVGLVVRLVMLALVAGDFAAEKRKT